KRSNAMPTESVLAHRRVAAERLAGLRQYARKVIDSNDLVNDLVTLAKSVAELVNPSSVISTGRWARLSALHRHQLPLESRPHIQAPVKSQVGSCVVRT